MRVNYAIDNNIFAQKIPYIYTIRLKEKIGGFLSSNEPKACKRRFCQFLCAIIH